MGKRWWQLGLPDKWPPADVQEWLFLRYGLDGAALVTCEDIFLDLKLSGDDCSEFLGEFSQLFDVDMNQFDWTKYSYSEGEKFDYFGLYRTLYSLVGKPWPPVGRPIYPISADHLIKVAAAKKWFDEEPTPAPRGLRS